MKPLLTLDELIHAMHLIGNPADIRRRLEKLQKQDPASYNALCRFYRR